MLDPLQCSPESKGCASGDTSGAVASSVDSGSVVSVSGVAGVGSVGAGSDSASVDDAAGLGDGMGCPIHPTFTCFMRFFVVRV
jgi:hypothetical protein